MFRPWLMLLSDEAETPAPATTPLSVSGRYLVDANGAPVYLTGFHTWASVQDGGESDPPPTFDWDAFLAALVAYGCNFTKLWAMETTRGWSDGSGYWFVPPRYTRTGPGNDADSKLKLDLTRINTEYIGRLRARAEACAEAGIYVCVQLFQGWQIESKSMGGAPWTYHPYAAANNINGVDGDQNEDGQGTETHFHTTGAGNNTVLAYQEALVTAIVDALNDLDNVIWEITNEDTGSAENTAWQAHMIEFLHAYEATKAKIHPVMMSWQYPSGDNASLTGSNADVVSTGGNDAGALTNPPTPSDYCNLFDTDHNGGLTDTYAWIWRSLCRGNGGAWYMDEWDGNYGEDRRANATYVLIRQNLGYALALAQRVPLLDMSVQATLCSTGWCLALAAASDAHYVCFQPGSGAFTLDLTTASGTLTVEWRNCVDGATSANTVAGGAVRTLTPPWSGPVVVYVHHADETSPAIARVSGQLTHAFGDGTTGVSFSAPGDVTAGNLLTVALVRWCEGNDPIVVGDITKPSGTATLGAWSLDKVASYNTSGAYYINVGIFSALVTGSGSLDLTVAGSPAGSYLFAAFNEYSSAAGWDAERAADDSSASAATGAPDSGNVACAGPALLVGAACVDGSGVTPLAQDAAWSLLFESEDGSAHVVGAAVDRIVAAAATDSASWSTPTTIAWVAAAVAYRPVSV